MERPIVRIIQNQEEVNNSININSYDAEQLLKKYGVNQQYNNLNSVNKYDDVMNVGNLSFDEMISRQNEIDKRENDKILQLKNTERPITFGDVNGYNSEIKYSSDEESGFSFKIQISSDMNLPRY